jgi:hypothetical protein
MQAQSYSIGCCQELRAPTLGLAQVPLPFTDLKPTQELPLLGQRVLLSVDGYHGTTFDNEPAQ